MFASRRCFAKNSAQPSNLHKEHTVTSSSVKGSVRGAVFTALALPSLLLAPAPLLAEGVSTAEWDISADRIIRYEDPSSIVAEGNIVLEKRVKIPPKTTKPKAKVTDWSELLGEKAPKKVTAGEIEEQVKVGEQYETALRIEADWLTYDVDAKTIKAKGNVKVIGKDDTLLADEGIVRLESETGTFTDATILREEDDLHLEGKAIEKTGLNTYHVADGWVITCDIEDDEKPPWSFSAADTTVEQDGYAVLKHAKFNIKGVPVLYSPYLVVPVKETRQSGLLLPEISSSNAGGFSFGIPYFWAINEYTDMTFIPEYYEDRGLMIGTEFRYALADDSKGEIIGNYLSDDLSDGDFTSEYYQDTGYTHDNQDRYWIRGKADHGFENGWLARLDFDVVSDRDYLTEFKSGYTGFDDTDKRFLENYGRGFENRTDDTRENTLKFQRSWNGMSLEGNFLVINDVREEKDNPTPLWKLPEINFAGLIPIADTITSFKWDADYVNYYREDGVGAHRFDVRPAISTPIPLSQYLESRAELGIRNTFYIIEEYGDGDPDIDYDSTDNRLLADFEMEVGSTLLRQFPLSGDTYTAFDHQVYPYVRYTYVTDVDQDDLPEFDDVDRILEENKITYGIDNFFHIYSDKSDREFGYLKIFQSYDFTDTNDGNFANEVVDEPFSDITTRLLVRPTTRTYLKYETDYNVYGDGFVRHSVESSYRTRRGDFFSLDYSYLEGEDVEQLNGRINAKLFNNWYTEIEVEQSLSASETNEANVSLIYLAKCWGLEFQTKYTPEDTRFMVTFSLANLGNPFKVDL